MSPNTIPRVTAFGFSLRRLNCERVVISIDTLTLMLPGMVNAFFELCLERDSSANNGKTLSLFALLSKGILLIHSKPDSFLSKTFYAV